VQLEAVHDSIGNHQHFLAAQCAKTFVSVLLARPQVAPYRERQLFDANTPPETSKLTLCLLCLCEANAHARNDEAWNMVAGSIEGAADSARVQNALASFAAQVSTPA